MGLSFHYNGRFRKEASLPGLINEVKDIADVCKWKYRIFSSEFPENFSNENEHNGEIYGISITPPECESVFFCFLSNGRMSNPFLVKFYGEQKTARDKEFLYMVSTKTQFAGIEVHKFIIQLFKHLQKQNYFEELNIIDEGEYWETGDEKNLETIFNRYDKLLDDFSLALKSVPKNDGESFDNYFERIVKKIDKRRTN